MKRLVIAASVGTILVGAYSIVYACNETRSTQSAQSARAPKAATWYAVEATTQAANEIVDKIAVCETVQSVAPITVEVDVPAEALHMARVIHIRGAAVENPEASTTPVATVKRTVKVAAALGRAFLTTVGAVFGSLVDAALEASASLV